MSLKGCGWQPISQETRAPASGDEHIGPEADAVTPSRARPMPSTTRGDACSTRLECRVRMLGNAGFGEGLPGW